MFQLFNECDWEGYLEICDTISILLRGEWAICHMALDTRGGLSGAQAATEFTVGVRERDGRLLEQRFVWGHVTPEQALGLEPS
jgi:hypothetical protein